MEKVRVLYVDDEEINLRVFRSSFRRVFEIYTAISATAGLKILSNQPIDIVITDQRMPEITGVEFLKQIHEMFPTIPPNRLIVSGYARDEDIEEAFDKYNLFGFISKPWKDEELKQTILKAIQNG